MEVTIGEIQQDDVLYQDVLTLRYRLFFQEHKLPKDILYDEKESASRHIVVTQQNTLIAYGRLSRLENSEFQISQVLVNPDHQRRGYGTRLLIALINIAKEKGAATLTLNARTTATQLYKKQGFLEVGHTFNSPSTNVPHIKMVYSVNLS